MDGQVRGVQVRSRHGAVETLPARVTLGADGQHSVIGRALGLSRSAANPRRWAVGAYFEGVTGLDEVGEMHVRAGQYLGVAPAAGGRANACVVRAPAAGEAWGTPAALLGDALAADPVLGPRFRDARILTRPVVLGPLAVDTPIPGAPGVLLLGDAAGFVDPMTGDGLHLAIRSAELAAEVSLSCLGGAVAPAELHRVYARRMSARLGRKRRFDRALRRLVASPGAVRAAAATARVWPGAFRAVIRYAGDAAGGLA
ncbi:MAG: hypothetical protein R2712_02355 [Vicinamibacterales bacterium]